MMKRTRAILVVLLMMCMAAGTASAKSTGYAVGGEGSLYLAGAGGLPISGMVTFHVPQLPLMFAVGISSPIGIAATVDYWAAHGNLSKLFTWYVGIGGYLAVELSSGGSTSLGGRIPIGIQAWPLGPMFEIFGEVAPAVGVSLVPTAFDWHLQAAVGLRVWL